nr:hypothetical protein [Allomuricauda sp.]
MPIRNNNENSDLIKNIASRLNHESEEEVDPIEAYRIEVMSQLGLYKESFDKLKITLGNHFDEIFRDEEIFQKLRELLKERGNNPIIDQDFYDLAKEEVTLIANRRFRNEAYTLLSNLEYDYVRNLIDNYIADNKGLKNSFLAELYLFKAISYSGKSLNHHKRRLFLEKAVALDEENPEILLQYGKHLIYRSVFEEAKIILEKALDLIKNDVEVEPSTNVRINTILADCLFQIELNKPIGQQNYSYSKKLLFNAIEINLKLPKENSEIHKIQKKLSEIAIAESRFNDAIDLIMKSLKSEENLVGLGHSNDTGLNQLNLGSCYSEIYLRNNDKDAYIKSKSAFEMAIKIFKTVNGEKHINVAIGYYKLGNLEIKQNTNRAIEYYHRAIDIIQSYEIVHSNRLGYTYLSLANAYLLKHQKKDALQNAFLGLVELRKVLPENHEEIIKIKHFISLIK